MPTATSPRASRTRWQICWRAALICALSILGLTSCATGTPATPAPPLSQPPPPPPPGLQASQRQPCPALPPARSSLASDLLANHDAVAALYRDCRARDASLLQAADEWLRTAWDWYCSAVDRLGLGASECRREARALDPDRAPGAPAR